MVMPAMAVLHLKARGRVEGELDRAEASRVGRGTSGVRRTEVPECPDGAEEGASYEAEALAIFGYAYHAAEIPPRGKTTSAASVSGVVGGCSQVNRGGAERARQGAGEHVDEDGREECEHHPGGVRVPAAERVRSLLA